MPLSNTGRCALKITSSASVYNSRVAKPPPVARRQSASNNQGGICERLSKEGHQELVAAITKSRPSRGAARRGASLGSIRERSRRARVLLALPCSPCKIKMGKGPLGLKVAINQATNSTQSGERLPSVSAATLTNRRKSLRLPPLTGRGRGNIPFARRNRTGGSATT